jgi:hypothetical protein
MQNERHQTRGEDREEVERGAEEGEVLETRNELVGARREGALRRGQVAPWTCKERRRWGSEEVCTASERG